PPPTESAGWPKAIGQKPAAGIESLLSHHRGIGTLMFSNRREREREPSKGGAGERPRRQKAPAGRRPSGEARSRHRVPSLAPALPMVSSSVISAFPRATG